MTQPRKSSPNHPKPRGVAQLAVITYHQRRRLATIRDENLTFEGSDCIEFFFFGMGHHFFLLKNKIKKKTQQRGSIPWAPWVHPWQLVSYSS